MTQLPFQRESFLKISSCILAIGCNKVSVHEQMLIQ